MNSWSQIKELNKDEEKLKNLLTNGLDTTGKLFALLIGVAFSSAVLIVPIGCLHTMAYRKRFFFNQSDRIDTNFYGFPTSNGEMLHEDYEFIGALLHSAMKVTCLLLTYRTTFSYSRIEHHVLVAAVHGFCLAAITVITFQDIGDNSEKQAAFQNTYDQLQIDLLLLHPTLLTLLQESIPKPSRGFATAIWCMSNVVLNWNCYKILRIVYTEYTVPTYNAAKLPDVVSQQEVGIVVAAYFGIWYSINWSVELESPYVYTNLTDWYAYWRSRSESTAIEDDDWPSLPCGHPLSWEAQRVRSLKLYWGLNMDNVSKESIDKMEEKCITKMRCEADNEQNTQLFVKTVVLQLSCCILQIPATLTIANFNSILRQLGQSSEEAAVFTEEMFALFVFSSLVSLFTADRFSQKTIVTYFGLSSMLIFAALGFLPLVCGVDREWLRTVLALFVLVNGVFLVPTTWTIIGDVCGKHRPTLLLTIIFFNDLFLRRGAQVIFETGGFYVLVATALPLNTLALGTFYTLYKEGWSAHIEKEEHAESTISGKIAYITL